MNKAVCCLPASESPGKATIVFRLLRACLASSCLEVFSTLPFFLELFPTALCRVLVFRLAPAAPLPRPPAAVHLTHHTSLIKVLLITPHSSGKTHHTSLIIHHALLITALLITAHHSSTSHTSLITSLITSHLSPHLSDLSHRAHHILLITPRSSRHTSSQWAGAVHRASWRSCGARGRHSPTAGFHLAGPLHRAFWRSWCVAAAGPRLPFVWQANYTEPSDGAATRSSSCRRLCVVPLPHESQPRASGAALPGCSVCCACHMQLKLCVLRLPHESQLRASGCHARRSSARRLCVVRLPHESQPRASTRAAASPEGSA